MIQLQQTADGSHTLFVPELDEHYHSVKGAWTESEHIFLQMGWHHSPAPSPQVLEIGFGTGLNAFLTLLAADRARRPTRYTTLERFPLSEEIVRQMNYPQQIAPERSADYQALHQAAWDQEVAVTPWFTLRKTLTDFTTHSFQEEYDVIYFDAFAPEKQPEMWSPSLFETLFRHTRPGGILTTYCAKGAVRRMLQAAGYTVERLPGPPGGKREILRATKGFSGNIM